tara:strand:- start:615 stop:1328 length:714 start_codon:yes stop_codon:yes gene_type:complete
MVDILVIMAHPDDAELCCSGTLISSIQSGLKVGMVDLTKGELGTRGNDKIRIEEAKMAAKVIGAEFRINLGLRDGFISSDEESSIKVVEQIRKHQPKIIITNSRKDRHPDHEAASRLVKKACFLSGLVKIETNFNGKNQGTWRPSSILYSIQSKYIEPDFVIDITKFYDKKIEAINCFKSQFYDPNSKEPKSFISSKEFMDFIDARAIEMGHSIGSIYGEGFTSENKVQINSLNNII